jgi:hypothetical protein
MLPIELVLFSSNIKLKHTLSHKLFNLNGYNKVFITKNKYIKYKKHNIEEFKESLVYIILDIFYIHCKYLFTLNKRLKTIYCDLNLDKLFLDI